MIEHEEHDERDKREERERQEGEDSSAAEKLPAEPAGDDPTPLGDTDQHSDAQGA